MKITAVFVVTAPLLFELRELQTDQISLPTQVAN